MIMIIKDSIVIDRYHWAYVTVTFLIIEELKYNIILGWFWE